MARASLLLLALCTGALIGCNKSKDSTQTAAQKAAPQQAAAPTAAKKAAVIPVKKSGSALPKDVKLDPALGKRLFMSGCANCHGPDGTGSMMRKMMPQIGDLTSAKTQAYSNEQLFEIISKGRNKMPPFKTIFPPEKIVQIIGHVRSLKKK